MYTPPNRIYPRLTSHIPQISRAALQSTNVSTLWKPEFRCPHDHQLRADLAVGNRGSGLHYIGAMHFTPSLIES
jgi:hypothetical protein